MYNFLIFGKKIKILRSGESNHLRSERRRENYTVFCTLKMGVLPLKCPQNSIKRVKTP